MHRPSIQLSAVLAILALSTLAGCQSTGSLSAPQDDAAPPGNPGFASEIAKFNAQFPNPRASQYEEVSLDYNNTNKLDERGNCHDLARHRVVVVLLLDQDGKVTGSTANVQSKKAQCFQQLYASAQFPRPPFAPYRKPLDLR